MIIMGQFSPILHKNICCGYSLEVPRLFLGRNKKNYPRIITKYSSLTIPVVYPSTGKNALFTHCDG